jgi:hypothetical protein
MIYDEAFIEEAKKIQDLLTPEMGMPVYNQYGSGEETHPENDCIVTIYDEAFDTFYYDYAEKKKFILLPSLGWLVRKLDELHANVNTFRGKITITLYDNNWCGQMVSYWNGEKHIEWTTYGDRDYEFACLLALNKILGR